LGQRRGGRSKSSKVEIELGEVRLYSKSKRGLKQEVVYLQSSTFRRKVKQKKFILGNRGDKRLVFECNESTNEQRGTLSLFGNLKGSIEKEKVGA